MKTPSVSPLRARAEGAATFNASVIYPSNLNGMWSYSTTAYSPVKLAAPMPLATGGGLAAKGYYYCNTYQEAMGFEAIAKFSYKIEDWSEYEQYTGSINEVATTMAYSPTRDMAFGCFINEERTGYNFVEWNYEYYGPKRVICPIERPWSGCSFDSEGTLYAIERNGDLYTVNLLNGAMTLVGSTGVASEYLTDAAIDPATDVMYWAVNTDTEYALYTVDLKTAVASKVYDLAGGEQLCGMYFPEVAPVVNPQAPAAVSSSPSLSFSGVSLTGSIAFYTPRMDASGNPLDTEKQLTYNVYANGKKIASDLCNPDGKRISVPLTMEVSDNYNFYVTTSNQAGESAPSRSTKKFVGPDTPKPVSRVSTTLTADNQVKLQWPSVSSSGVCGGSVNTSGATYTVTRYPDKAVLAEGLTTTSFTTPLPTPEVRSDIYYGVSVTCSGSTTAQTYSTAFPVGPIVPAADLTFPASLNLAGWTIIDGNADNTKFTFYSSDKALQLSGTKGFDDWAVTPVIKVKANYSYPIVIEVKTSGYSEDSFELMWGTEPTAEAMTNTVVAKTALKSSTYQTIEANLVPTVTGDIYLGFHGCTESPSRSIYLKSIKIGEGLNAKAPAAVTGLKAESPADGSLRADLSFTVPSTNLGGETLEGEGLVSKVVVSRDGKEIATVTEGLVPGQTATYTDKAADLVFGTHVYSLVAVNAFGDSPAAEAEALVGPRKPVKPEWARMAEPNNDGEVVITWAPVTSDVDGNPIPEGAVTYKVIDRQYNVVAENLTETSLTYRAVEEGSQAFAQFGVYAVTVGGTSDKMAATSYIPVGTPYAAPWHESFPDGEISSIFGYNYISGNEPWQFISKQDEWGIVPQDGDNGFCYFECYGGVITALVTGKISLEGLDNPAFTYFTYNFESTYLGKAANTLTVQVDLCDGTGWHDVETTVVDETGPYGQWNKVIVSLMEYEGKSVVFRILPGLPGKDNLAFFTLDNLSVVSYAEYNLAARQLTAPVAVNTGEEFEIEVMVENTGENAIRNFTVELWRNDEPVDQKELTDLAPQATKTVTFSQKLDIMDGEDAEYKSVIVCSQDQIESDNTSAPVTVGLVAPSVPVVDDLAATGQDATILLSWSAPDLTSAPGAPVTETFEGATAWANAVDGWKFVDADLVPVGGSTVAGIPTGLQSWFVVNNQIESIISKPDPTPWAAKSGNQYIASQYVMKSGESWQSDDWAITPQVNPVEQMLTFYARSFQSAYPETFEVLISSTTTNIDDFTSVATFREISAAWTKYSIKLPKGTGKGACV